MKTSTHTTREKHDRDCGKPEDIEAWSTRDQVMQHLDVSRWWVHKYMYLHPADPMPFRRVGRILRYRLCCIDAWYERLDESQKHTAA